MTTLEASHLQCCDRLGQIARQIMSLERERATLRQLADHYAAQLRAERALTPQPPTRCRANDPEAQPTHTILP